MGDETMDIKEVIEENTQGKTSSKRNALAEPFSISLVTVHAAHEPCTSHAERRKERHSQIASVGESLSITQSTIKLFEVTSF
jgi:hypothetical protein